MMNIDIDFFKRLIIEKYDEVKKLNQSGFTVKCFLKREYPDFFEFIEKTYPGDFGQKLFLFTHDMAEIPKCQYCHERDASWYGFHRGFGKWCSMMCMNKDPSHQHDMHQTMLEKYGCEHALGVKEINEKFRKTFGNKETNPEKFKIILEKRIQTSRERYGVDNVMLSKDISDKQKAAIKEKYGIDHAMWNDSVKEKFKQSIMSNIESNPHYWEDRQRKTEQTFLEKYGTTHPQRDLGLGIEKRKNTCKKRYGKDWFTQTVDCHRERRKSIKCDDMSFDSAWERDVYIFCKDHSINCEYQPDVIFEYTCNGETHSYHPDFRINGKLYEVKGDHFFRINESTGQEEMFMPFRDKSMDDEAYNKLCKCYEAKHQCMITNGVKILRSYEMEHLEEILLA